VVYSYLSECNCCVICTCCVVVVQLLVKGRPVDLINDVIDSSSVRDCSAEAPPSCATQPCKNGGTCEELGGRIWCQCVSRYGGPTCEQCEFCYYVTASSSKKRQYVVLNYKYSVSDHVEYLKISIKINSFKSFLAIF